MAPLRPAGLAALARALAPHLVAASVAGLPIAVFGATLGSGLAALTERRPSTQSAPALVAPAVPPRRRPPPPPREAPPPPPSSIDPEAALLWQVYEGWCAPLAAALCRIVEACCVDPPVACTDEAYAACTAAVDARVETRPLGELRFDRELARACLAQVDLGRATCEVDHVGGLDPGHACPVPLVLVDRPEPCVVDAHVCLGPACDDDGCRPLARAGEEGDCWPGHAWSRDGCQPLPRLGERCEDTCEPGLSCSDGTCRRPSIVGERCALFDDCANGLHCVARRCQPGPWSCAFGSECGVGSVCLAADGTRLPYRIHGDRRRASLPRERTGTCTPVLCESDRVLSLLGGRAGERVTP